MTTATKATQEVSRPWRAARLKRLARRLAITFSAAVAASFVALAVLWLLFPFPEERLGKWAVSPTVLDAKGRPMLAVVGSDDQWRQPVPLRCISPWLVKATIAVEDERFYWHPGVDPLAAARALVQNVAARRVVSGASTLDMQICRMMDDRPRNLRAKVIESFRALQLNRLKSKDEILELYLNTAPYGGNIRGVEMASLAYFGRSARDLTLAEAALIAGLPKSPSRYRPDRRLEAAVKRQRVVLAAMLKKKMITRQQFRDARSDPMAISKSKHPPRAWHAAWMALKLRPQGGRTSIDLDIQTDLERLADEHGRTLPTGSELAVVIIDVARSSIVGMVGSGDVGDPVDGQVNGVLARRSPGSALKPFIYAAAFEIGRLNSKSIVYDIPIRRAGWSPDNFTRTFAGEIAAGEALRRSLNIPAILVAEEIGLARCCGVLEAVGINVPASAQTKSGLTLAVGGLEVSLLELTNAYATLGRAGLRQKPHLFPDEPAKHVRALAPNVCAAIDDILSSRRRRPLTMEAFLPEDIPWFMWKTGTSSGRRDAWAVGHNRRYAIGVWVGRFRGTGRVAYVGAEAAQPLLAGLFDLPSLRVETDPPVPAPIVVRRPLSPPAEIKPQLQITSPGDGDTFICLNRETVIRPAANYRASLLWFLNGRLLDDDSAARLVLTPGSYELLCVDRAGQSSTVCFNVR